MKRLALTSLLLLAGCSSAPAEPFEPTTPHNLVGWSISEDGSACPIWDLEQGITVWCGVHRIGEGPDIWNAVGQNAIAVNVGDE